MDVILQLFESLESNNPSTAEEAKKTFHEYFGSTKETWLVNGLFDYYLNTGSMRAVEVLISIREPHEKYLFDRIGDTIRGQQHKFQALTLLGYVVKRHPTWLYKITHHPLLKELLRLLKTETDILSLMSALLIVVILLPIIAGLFGPYLQDIFEIFSRLAAWNTNNPNKFPEGHLLHLQIGLYALFNRLYGMYPCNFLSYLQNQYTMKENFPIFTHTIKPMLDTVKMHPLLVTASKEAEVSTVRWKKMEANDVIMECAKFTVDWGNDKLHEDCSFRARTSSFISRPSIDYCGNSFGLNKLDSSTNGIPVVGPFSANLSDTDVWSPASHTGALTPTETTSVPLTPISQSYLASSSIPQITDGNSPPEAAVEATPESTPIKELREPDLRVLAGSSGTGTIRALNSFNVGGHSQPSSPMKKDSSFFQFPSQSPQESSAFHTTAPRPKDNNLMLQRVQRVVLDRMQVVDSKETLSPPQSGSSKGVSGYQPSSPLRVISSPPFWGDHSNPNSPHPSALDHTDEDREVESTMRTETPSTSLFKRMDSVNQEAILPEAGASTTTSSGPGGEEFEDCIESEAQGCTQGGLHMPDSRQMMKFAHQFSRMRFYSQCQSETVTLQQMGESSSSSSPKETSNTFIDVSVRRAVSCPEMKKETSGFGGFSDLGVVALAETEEEADDPTTLHAHVPGSLGSEVKEQPKLISNSTQTDDPPSYDLMGYEHLFLPVFPIIQQQSQHPPVPSDVCTNSSNEDQQISSPHSALQNFIDTTVKNMSEKMPKNSDGARDDKVIKEQLILLSLQLQYERHRREVHAERNRRLLGKSRNNRALEEHNLALKDQVSLMQKEIEMLRKELERSKFLGKSQIDQIQQSLDYWQEQSAILQKECKVAKAKVIQLEVELKEEKTKLAAIAKGYSETQSEVFKLEKSLHQAFAMASAGREVKNELSHLQHQLAAAGEIEANLKSRYASLVLRSQQDTEALILKQSYSHSQSATQQALDMKQSLLDAAQTRISELQALVDHKDSVLEEQKDLYLKSKDEYNKKIKELERKCEDLRRMNNHQGQQALELQHKIEKLKADHPPNKSQPLSPPITSLHLGSSEGLISGLEPSQLWNLQTLVNKAEACSSSDDTPVSSLQM